ncbi:MAG: pyridoxamine 5'-phosphate oxidase family protein [Deltaproteobacteria bacterium]|nr:pyridoxamine 5'-phosphate oxidase family protein [Deltaproteobacteria bacterium]
MNTTPVASSGLVAASSAASSLAGLRRLLKSFDTVLLATVDRPGDAPHLNTRLMSVAGVDDDCTLSFFSVAGIHDGRGHVIAQAKTCAVNLTGVYGVSRKRAQMAALFSKAHQSWFPRGLDEPGLCLITFKPQAVELRDMGRVQRIALDDRTSSSAARAPTFVMSASSLALAAWSRMKRRTWVDVHH